MTTYLPAPTSAPSVVVVPGAHAPAGHEATVRVHLRNLADGLREMSLTVLGLDAEWLPGPVRTGTVAPDETVTVELPVRVGAGAVPGTYPFALAVEAYLVGAPAARPSARTLLDSTLEVDAPSEVVLTVEPAETRAVLRRKVNVVLSNSGEEPVPLEVTTVTERGLRMSVPDAVTVPARGTVTVPAKLSVLRPQIIGHRNRMAYTVTARGRQAPAKFRGTLTARPLLGFTGMRVVAVVAALALWVAGLGMGVPWLSEKVTAEQGEVLAEGGADGAGADPDGGADGGEGGGGEGGGVAEGVRIGGVVAGTDPAGVRVDIAPASVLDLQTVPTAEEAAAGDGERTASASDRGGLGANLALGGGGGGSGGGGMLGTAVPGLLGAALAGPLPAAVDSDEPTGKTPAGALAITRTEALDAARSTSTLEDGTWAFAGMSATTNYLITLSKPGYQTQRFLVSGAEAAAAALETELVAGAGRLAGTVTGPDGPAGGADITITDGTTTVTTSTNTTGDVGAWAVEGLSTPATYLVTAAGANLGAQAALVTLAAGSQERVDLTLTDATTTLTGKATGPDSLGAVGGLGGITVTATDGTTTRTASTATGELAGTFVLADLPVPATYTVTVEADGYASQSREMQLTAGADAAADFRLGVSTGVVQGTVRTPDGTGLDGVGLTLSDDENTYKTMNASDDAGSFRLNGVAPGEYVLQAELFGHVPGFAQLTVEAGSVATADLVLTPVPDNGLVQTGRIQGRVSDATTNGQITCPSDVAAADCVITVEMKAQDGEDGSTRDITVTTAPDLEYTIPAADGTGLLPGLYTLTISAPGYEAGEVRVQVPMGETAQASPVALYRSPSITGVIAARVGTVPADTCVVAAPAGTPADGACLVDSGAVCKVADAAETVRCAPVATNGSYTLDQLASGTWSVSVRTPQGSEYLDVPPVSLTLEPGELRRYDATLDRLAHVALTVLYDRGGSILEPATTATITPIRIDSGDTPEPLTTDATGYALITHLPVGSYRFDVAYTPAGSARTYTGATPILTVGLNQELTRQLVLTGGTGYPIEGQVFTSLGAGGTPPIAGLEVKVTGITGYSGLVPVRESVTMTTAVADPATGSLPTGSFRVVTTGGTDVAGDAIGVMTFISDQVDVTIVDRLGRYKSRTITGVSLVSPAVTLEVEPIGRPVVVEVRGVATEDRKNLSFRVEQMPPGASAARIAIRTVGENTTLVWHDDLAQPYANPASYESGTHIRPGTYWITPVLAGYQAVAQKVDVPTLDGPLTESTVPFEITLDLSKYASLSIEVVRAGSCTSKDGVVESGTCKAVNDPVVTVTGAGQGDITAAAITGTNRVNFGLLPSGTYQVYVQAAGHRFGWYPVKLEAAQTAPEIVAVDQLGTLTGTVRSEVGAQALAGVQVEARLGAGEPFTAVTDSTGTYWITGTTSRMGLEPAGSGQGDQGDDDWTVTASAPGYTATGPSVVDVIPGSVTRDLILSPLPVDLFIDVYDPDRDPAAGTLIDGLDVVLMQGAANWKGADLTDTTLPGRYHFTDVLPGVYTVSVSGGGYAPLIASITVPATGEAAFVSLSIASRRNTVTGTVLGQTGGSAAAPLGGATVTLTALDTGDTGDTGDTLPKFTPVFPTPSVGETGKVPGQFAFYNVPDGDYTLTAAHEDYGGATNAATRAVRVQGGQIFSVDIVLYETARQVEVNVKSLNYFDLTGILVRLVPPAGSTEAPLAPQPAVRSADDPHVYTTVFNQVPPGTEWTAIASGPWGHFGTHKGKVDTGTATVSVDEMRVRVSATGAGSPPPLKVTVREGDATGPLVADVFVGVNAGTESIYLPAGTYSLVATATDGSTLQQSEITVTDDRGNDVSAAFVLTSTSDAATTTTLTAGASTVSAGGTLTLTADVAADSTVTTGSVTFLRNRVPIVATGNPATVTDGSAALAVTGLDAGVHGFTAQYSGGTGVQPSVSGSVFVVVSAPGASATNIVVGTTVRGSAVDFSLTSNTGVAGTIRLHVSGAASFVKDYTTSGEAVTDTWMAPMPGAYTAYAELSPTDTAAHAPSRSDVHSFTILPPPVATKTPTTTTVAISPDPAETSPVTLTATVSPAPGGGTVTFTSTSGSTTATVASGVEVNESGQATVTLAASTWAAANYTIRATFNGSATHAISSGTNTFKKK